MLLIPYMMYGKEEFKMANTQTIDVSEYANTVASEKFFQFAGALWTPVVVGYNNDPTLMIVKKIVDVAIPTAMPIPVADDEFVSLVEEPKPIIRKGSGDGLAKAKAAAAKAMEKPVANEGPSNG
jgi:hypothetical protein